MKQFRRILVPVDFSPCARLALEHAFAIGRPLGARVDVLHTWTAPPYIPPLMNVRLDEHGASSTAIVYANDAAKRGMATFLQAMVPPDDLIVTPRIEFGNAADVIIAASKQYDLVVMGTHGRTGLARIVLGSVAARVIQHAFCPVLTVREDTTGAAETEAAPELRRHPEEKTLYGLFDSTEAVERAFDRMMERGVAADDISIILREGEADYEHSSRRSLGKGLASGSAVGGSLGGILGGLVVMGSTVTGIGAALLVMGPALALAGAGGLIGGLLGWGIPKDEARHIQAAVEDGRALLAVHLHDKKSLEEAKRVLTEFGARSVTVSDAPDANVDRRTHT